MRRTGFCTALALVGSVAWGQAGAASTPCGGSEEQLAGIRATLDQIARLMAAQTKEAKLDVAFRRVEVSLQQLLPLQAEASTLRASKQRTESQIASLTGHLESVREQLNSGRFEPGNDEESLSREIRGSERVLTRYRRELPTSNARLSEIELEVSRLQAEVDEWKRFLDQQLARHGE